MSHNCFVILNYNDAETTQKLVKVLREYESLEHIVVVDNCSKDNSYQVLKELQSEKCDVIQSPVNGGYAKGNNFGIRYAIEHYNPEIIFVGNPDIMVEENVLGQIQAMMGKYSKFGVISCVVRQGYNIWNLAGFVGVIEHLFMIWFNVHKKMIKSRIIKSSRELEKVGVVEGSFFAIRQEAFQKINGLDEDTFLYCEEDILAKRMSNAGYHVGVLPHAYYDHFHSVSIRKEYRSKAKAFPNFYNSYMIYLNKYLKIGKVKKCIFDIAYKLAYFERKIYDLLKR